MAIGNIIIGRLKTGVVPTASGILFRSRLIHARGHICVLLGGPGSYIAAISSPRTRGAILSLIHGTYSRHICPIKHLSHGAANILLVAGSNSLAAGLARPQCSGGGVCRMAISRSVASRSFSGVTGNLILRSNSVGISRVDFVCRNSHHGMNIRVRSNGGHVIHHVFSSLNCQIIGLSHICFTNLAGGGLPHNG